MFQRLNPGNYIAEKLKNLFAEADEQKLYRIIIPSGPVVFKDSLQKVFPSIVIYGSDSEDILFAADVDVQTCGRNEDHSAKLKVYEQAGLWEHWLIFPADGIIVKRSRPEFQKRQIYSRDDSVPCSLFRTDFPAAKILN